MRKCSHALITKYLRSLVSKCEIDAQRSYINNRVRSYFGFASVEFSALDEPMNLKPATGNHWVTGDNPNYCHVCCSPAAWPFANGELDCVVLHHILEFSREPHEVFRDSCRIVKDGGHIVIVSCNPFSLIWFRKWWLWLRRRPIDISMLSESRTIDWCRLMGFKLEHIHHGSLWPSHPHKVVNTLDRILNLIGIRLGQTYIIVAKKERVSPTQNYSKARQFIKGIGRMPQPAVNRERS